MSLSGGKFYWVVGGIAFLATVVATTPASVLKPLLNNAGDQFGYARVEGRIWDGVLRKVTIDGADLGDVSFKVKALALLRGQLSGSVQMNGSDIYGTADISVSANKSIQVKQAALNANLTTLSRRYAFMGQPIEGAARLNIDRFVYTSAGCRAASGDVWTDVLQGPARALNGEAFDLSGPITCENGTLAVVLSGQGGEGAATMSIALNPDMSYVLRADASPQRNDVSQALQLIGFERGPAGLTYGATGVFKGV